MSVLHQQNTFQGILNEEEFPSLPETGSKDFANINISSTADSISYCAKLKTAKDGKIKNTQTERGICNDEPICKVVVSESIKTCNQNLATNSHFCFGNEKKFTENNPKERKDSRSLSLNELVTFSDQSDEKDNGWIVVKKKIPHLQTEENNKISNKTKIGYKNFLKNRTTSIANVSLPKYKVQNMQCTSKKKYFYDSKVTSINKESIPQIKVTDSDKKKFNSNNSSNFKSARVDSGHFVNFKRDEALEDSKKQSINIPSRENYSHSNKFVKKSSSQTDKEQLRILNKTLQNSFEALSSQNNQKAFNFSKNKTENSKKLCHNNDFKSFTDQNKKDLNKSFSGNFSKNELVESKKNSDKPIPGSSKKKRKSKVKRQAAMQCDKIRIITPEMFSKIMNLCNNEKVQSPKNISVNIYDSNEYPELGSSSLKSEKISDGFEISKKDTSKKCSLTIEKSAIDSGIMESSEDNSNYLKDHDISVESNCIEDEYSELKKLPVHHNNPITISLFDMLSVNKPKKKETEKPKEFPGNLLSVKSNLKKQTLSGHHQNVNPLDSSKPAVKRGKEREKPKPKRLSRFKKIVLLDRERRKEQTLKQYTWNKLYTEKNVLSHTAKSSERTNEEELMKLTAANFSNIEMQHLLQINNSDKMLCGNLPEHIMLLNLCSSLENNINNGGLYLNSCTNVNDCNGMNEKNLISNHKKHSLTEIIVENSSDISQMHLSNTKCKMLDEKERENNAFGELNISSTVQNNHFASFTLFNQTESSKSESCLCKDFSLNPKLEISPYEPGLTEIQYLFKNWNASKMFSEEQNLDEILCDIQYLFLHEGEINFFPCTGISTKLHCNAIHDKKTSNNLPVVDEMHKKGTDNCLIETVSYDFENTGKNKASNLATEGVSETIENKASCGFHRIYSDKEIMQAAYIVLHSKKFRDYCTHFSSNELGETVFALLDDLARFQDRMHKKDPVKARMKRRLIYGIREIKRHTKLKKLKCIIIATDIEDSKTEGGLNDIVNDLKALAKDYHIPCVFSHLRKKLGKICHKPAPVSAVGVLNYEGSEVNFKKMLEFQSMCKMDYEKVLKSLLSKLTDVQVELLHTTKTQDPAHVYSTVSSLIKELFPHSGEISNFNNNRNIENFSVPGESSVFKENSKCLINKDVVEAIEINDILIKYKVIN